MYGVWVQHTSLLCRGFLLLRINSPMVVASGSYSVTDPIRCRSTASGSTAGRSTAVGQRHFPFGAQSGIARYNSYFIPPTLAFLLSLLLRLGQWSRVSLQQHAVAGIGRETRSPAFPSASRSSAKRATSTRHRGSQREGQKKAGKANLIYMACAAPVWCSSYVLCTHTKMERMVCVQIHRTQTGQKAGT